MSVSSGRAELYDALKSMRQSWEQAQILWRDGVAEDFGVNHWQPLEQQAQAALAAMDRLAQLLLQVRRDCS